MQDKLAIELPPLGSAPLRDMLDIVARRIIADALRGRSLAATAQILQTHPANLRARMRRLGLQLEPYSPPPPRRLIEQAPGE